MPDEHPRFDTSVASAARVYSYWLGGKDTLDVPYSAPRRRRIVDRSPQLPSLPEPEAPPEATFALSLP